MKDLFITLLVVIIVALLGFVLLSLKKANSQKEQGHNKTPFPLPRLDAAEKRVQSSQNYMRETVEFTVGGSDEDSDDLLLESDDNAADDTVRGVVSGLDVDEDFPEAEFIEANSQPSESNEETSTTTDEHKDPLREVISSVGKMIRPESDEISEVYIERRRTTGSEDNEVIMRLDCTGPFSENDRFSFDLTRSDFPVYFSGERVKVSGSCIVFDNKRCGINSGHFLMDINESGQLVVTDLASARGIRVVHADGGTVTLSNPSEATSERIRTSSFKITAAYVNISAELLPASARYLNDRFVELTAENLRHGCAEKPFTVLLHNNDTIGRAKGTVYLDDESAARFLGYIHLDRNGCSIVSVSGGKVYQLEDKTAHSSVELKKGTVFYVPPYRFTVKDVFTGLDFGLDDNNEFADDGESERMEQATVQAKPLGIGGLLKAGRSIVERVSKSSDVSFVRSYNSKESEPPILRIRFTGPFDASGYTVEACHSDLPLSITCTQDAISGSQIVFSDRSLLVCQTHCSIDISDHQLCVTDNNSDTGTRVCIGGTIHNLNSAKHNNRGDNKVMTLAARSFMVSCGWIKAEIEIIAPEIFKYVHNRFVTLNVANMRKSSDEEPFIAVAYNNYTIGRSPDSDIILRDDSAHRYCGYFTIREGVPFCLNAVSPEDEFFGLPDGSKTSSVELTNDVKFSIGAYLITVSDVFDGDSFKGDEEKKDKEADYSVTIEDQSVTDTSEEEVNERKAVVITEDELVPEASSEDADDTPDVERKTVVFVLKADMHKDN